MERKNTILLTVIAVATLLVAVVGATFAYFTATSTQTGDVGEGATGKTASVSGTNLVMASATNHSELQYPGGFAFAGASAKAVKTKEGVTDNYTIDYDLQYTITNGTKTQLNYKLYRSTSQVNLSKSEYCGFNDENEEGQLSYTCDYSELFTDMTAVVNNGTVAANGNVNTTYHDKLNTSGTTANTGEQVYYYLVVDYPETGAPQDNDQGATISASITGADNLVATIIQ